MPTNGNGKANGHTQQEPTSGGSPIPWPAPIADAGLRGIAGDFVHLVAEHTEADPNAILLCFLAYAGNLLGRQFYIPTGADEQCGNLYLCLVGPTAGGRKGSAISAAEVFFTKGVNAPGVPRIIRGISSGEGVIWKVHDEIKKPQWNKKTNAFEDVVIEQNEVEKRSMYSLSEFQQNITNMRRPESVLSSILRQAWDKDTIESPSKNSSAKATGAHVSMVAGISKEELLLETTAVDAQNGTLNRFLFACTKRSHLLPEGDTLHQLIQQPEWGELQSLFKNNVRNEMQQQTHVRRNIEAQRDWGLNKCPEDGGLYKTLSELRTGLWGTITARAAQQVIRLSLITAVINGRHSITTEDQDAAWEYWRYCDDSCKYIWGDTTDETSATILTGLRGKTEGLTRSDIYAVFSGHRSKQDIDGALAWLAARGLAHSRTMATGERGRPAERWYSTL